MYKFLVTNDDGITAAGLQRVVRALTEFGTVYIVAPNSQQSAKSMALTFREKIVVEEHEIEGAEIAYAINGTPVDCIKWGMDKFKDIEFDYVISGINMGYNLGTAPYYSGTVAAAREGALQGVRALALSVESHEASEFEYVCQMMPRLLEMSHMLGHHTLLNVNAPNKPASEIKGVRIVPGARHDYGESYHFVQEEDGRYQLSIINPPINEHIDNDFNALAAGYATITPITAYIDDPAALERLLENYPE